MFNKVTTLELKKGFIKEVVWADRSRINRTWVGEEDWGERIL